MHPDVETMKDRLEQIQNHEDGTAILSIDTRRVDDVMVALNGPTHWFRIWSADGELLWVDWHMSDGEGVAARDGLRLSDDEAQELADAIGWDFWSD